MCSCKEQYPISNLKPHLKCAHGIQSNMAFRFTFCCTFRITWIARWWLSFLVSCPVFWGRSAWLTCPLFTSTTQFAWTYDSECERMTQYSPSTWRSSCSFYYGQYFWRANYAGLICYGQIPAIQLPFVSQNIQGWWNRGRQTVMFCHEKGKSCPEVVYLYLLAKWQTIRNDKCLPTVP